MPFMNKNKLKNRFSSVLDIPRDVMLDLPKLTIIGDIQIYIENHRGIIEYTSALVRLSTSLGQLIIKGENLVLRNISVEEIYIEGRIQEVGFGR
ncbi:MAG: sporulation protein [Clostridiaceae bacterium BRH_c20a]|nr:MAG: sporulation protein [Clostridiaceae bacterium BRH_c20a]